MFQPIRRCKLVVSVSVQYGNPHQVPTGFEVECIILIEVLVLLLLINCFLSEVTLFITPVENRHTKM
jgi:hypothetical protein